jgi:hypothetical protein
MIFSTPLVEGVSSLPMQMAYSAMIFYKRAKTNWIGKELKGSRKE